MNTFSTSSDADELLRQAADAARRMIPIIEDRLKMLMVEMQSQQEQLMRLQKMASLGGTETVDSLAPYRNIQNALHDKNLVVEGCGAAGTDIIKHFGNSGSRTFYFHAIEESTDPLAVRCIDQTLQFASAPMKVSEIREIIKQFFGRTYAESTIYSHLGKGKTEGKYVNENNKWSLTEKVTPPEPEPPEPEDALWKP